MKKFAINNWILKRVSDGSSYRTEVPGSVLYTLQDNGVIPDPFVADNEKFALKMMEEDFEYEAKFDIDHALMTSLKKELVFEGIDTVGEVYLNGSKILCACNMHRTYRIDITDFLKEKDNELKVCIRSALKYIKDAYEKSECDGTEDAMEGFVHIRKAHYMFGWDWGPRIPDAGLFRPVYILGINTARIENVRVHQRHSGGKAGLRIFIDREVYGDDKGISCDVILTDPQGKELKYENYRSGDEIVVEDPLLWWPSGFGEQNLYNLDIKLKLGNTELDSLTKRIGLRTLTITKKKDEWGESFAHCINGFDVFAFGADYIPEDNYLTRMTPERTRKLLEDCKLANFNSIRVWGGGFFPDDAFYDICDELGIMVWQDMMFACGVYDLTEEFEENIRLEIKDNLRRIADHACLALICGNNEMEMFVKNGVWVKTHKQKADYIKMYEYLFPKWVKEYAPDAVYWPSSPSSGGSFDDPNDFDRGDVHFWQVWHDGKPFTEYRKYFFRYLSEFGFQALPSKKTLETVMTSEEDFNLFSYNMEKHQRNKSANSKIMQYMQATFKYPTDFDILIYASQLLSGEAIRYGVEHFRRNRGRCMGTLYWQLNDCWPVISWASVDYYGRWKALHYYAKRFFAPVLLSCEETSTVSEGIEINSENSSFIPAIKLNISNETMTERKHTVEWKLRDAFGKEIDGKGLEIDTSGTVDVTVSPLSSKWVTEQSFPEIDIYSCYVSFKAIEEGEVVSEGTALFVPAKYFRFEDPGLTVRMISENEIEISAKAFAKNIEIRNENDDLVLSDNFFDMNPGVKVVRIIRGDANNLTVRSVADIH
ncbi:beta-mannosidase [Butyrivibrio sp. AE2005]|uniref:beta-mannosidase n=1 Tax=Butyrivibrio sp. AE2005 TaxID=1496722 RepID=UPI00047E4292|nr:glycoside hydrolase family 2 protein [Butyrivibrio sp. AE2005]